jgi:hypothetical protein
MGPATATLEALIGEYLFVSLFPRLRGIVFDPRGEKSEREPIRSQRPLLSRARSIRALRILTPIAAHGIAMHHKIGTATEPT